MTRRHNVRGLQAGRAHADLLAPRPRPYTLPPVARRQRHLDESEPAMVGRRTAALKDGQRQAGKHADVPSQSEAASTLNLNECSLWSASVVLERGVLDLVRALDRGGVSSGDT